jgi:glyoxylase-like metal-dependent hydrolase (beta-lactamase superfamily II)
MKRVLIVVSVVCVLLILLLTLGMWAVAKGMSPLVDGAQLQDGRVTVVVDKTSPMPVAAYILRFSDGSLGLVDATMDPDARALRAALRRLGKSESDVKVILCTHSHDDHTAGRKSFPAATTYLMKPPPEVRGDPGASGWNRVQEVLPKAAADSARRAGAVTYLTDGERLDRDGDKIEAFAVPGHTYDSCAYLVFGVLFMGDSAAGQYDGKIGSAPPFVSVDREMNRRELKELAARLQGRKGEIDYLTFGHQGPIAGLEPLLAWAASH